MTREEQIRKDKKEIDCRICGNPTNVRINISYAWAPICEYCAKTIAASIEQGGKIKELEEKLSELHGHYSHVYDTLQAAELHVEELQSQLEQGGKAEVEELQRKLTQAEISLRCTQLGLDRASQDKEDLQNQVDVLTAIKNGLFKRAINLEKGKVEVEKAWDAGCVVGVQFGENEIDFADVKNAKAEYLASLSPTKEAEQESVFDADKLKTLMPNKWKEHQAKEAEHPSNCQAPTSCIHPKCNCSEQGEAVESSIVGEMITMEDGTKIDVTGMDKKEIGKLINWIIKQAK